MDLISTIGESAALGAAGVILWGDAGYTTSTVSASHTAGQNPVSRDRLWGAVGVEEGAPALLPGKRKCCPEQLQV